MADRTITTRDDLVDEMDRLTADNERLRAALLECKYGAEYPDELGDIIDAALGIDEQKVSER